MINNEHFYFFYKTTNLMNNKYYYGVHSTKKLDDGYLGSGTYLRRSINKYGKDNFIIDIIEFFSNKEDMLEKEKNVVNEKLLLDKNCMNLRPGGFGGFSSKEQSENAKKSNIRQKWLRENDLDWYKKCSENKTNSMIKQYENGVREKVIFYDWTNCKHKDESKKKIGLKNSISQKGIKNSQFNTCWIILESEKKCIKINKNDLNDYLLIGWKKGRKMSW
jgi:hypothetical protein